MGKFDIKKLITEELNSALEEELKNSDDFEITSDYVSLVRFIRGGQITEVIFKDPKIAENIVMRWSSVSNKLRVIAFYDDNTVQLHTDQLVHYAINQLVPKDGNRIIYTRPKENMVEAKYYSNPSCPSCKHYNAMLVSKSHEYGQAGTSTRKCRDCGFEADYSDKEMEDIGNNTETNKKLGEQNINEGPKDWSKANLEDRELAFVVALYNNYSGEPKKTVDDYQSINLESAKMYFDEYINGTESSPVGLSAARKILTKLWKIK